MVAGVGSHLCDLGAFCCLVFAVCCSLFHVVCCVVLCYISCLHRLCCLSAEEAKLKISTKIQYEADALSCSNSVTKQRPYLDSAQWNKGKIFLARPNEFHTTKKEIDRKVYSI